MFWFRQAVQVCDAQSLFSLGRAYWTGEGVAAADQITGFQLMRMADGLSYSVAREHLRTLIREKKVKDLHSGIEDRYRR